MLFFPFLLTSYANATPHLTPTNFSLEIAEPQKTVIIGLILGGEFSKEPWLRKLKEEIQANLPENTLVKFKTRFTSPVFQKGPLSPLNRALSDPEVDVVLATSRASSLEAAQSKKSLAKPVVSSFFFRSQISHLPWEKIAFLNPILASLQFQDRQKEIS